MACHVFLSLTFVQGTNDTLNEPDVWEMSPTMRSRAVYFKFSAIQYVPSAIALVYCTSLSGSQTRLLLIFHVRSSFPDAAFYPILLRRKTLLRRLWAANSLDLLCVHPARRD